jgi:hypothetical protein
MIEAWDKFLEARSQTLDNMSREIVSTNEPLVAIEKRRQAAAKLT